MKKLHWLFMMMCLAVLPALQSCDDLDGGYSIGDFSYPNWATIRVKGNAFYMESDTLAYQYGYGLVSAGRRTTCGYGVQSYL